MSKRVSRSGGATSNSNSSSSSVPTLTGMAAVEHVFHFLDGPAEVLRASTASRRWRALAGADSVWRARFRREKLLEKARLFEVALPAVPGGQGGAAAAAAAAAVVRDELAGVGLAFYARIFALKVARGSSTTQPARRHRARISPAPASRSHRHRRRAGVPDEGRDP